MSSKAAFPGKVSLVPPKVPGYIPIAETKYYSKAVAVLSMLCFGIIVSLGVALAPHLLIGLIGPSFNPLLIGQVTMIGVIGISTLATSVIFYLGFVIGDKLKINKDNQRDIKWTNEFS